MTLTFNEEAFAQLQALKEFAEANPVSLEVLQRMASGEHPPIGDDERYRRIVAGGCRVVYSIEEQPNGKMRHLSVSLQHREFQGQLPKPQIISLLMEALGYKNPIWKVLHLWVEGDIAVNVLDFYTGQRALQPAQRQV